MSDNDSNAGEAGYWLGLDTGGTFTDAVLLADGRRVVASAKSLTTPWDLAIGIGRAHSRGARAFARRTLTARR